jgi:succinate dehydrogenase/fumarate reductase flavoprotein subunit
MGGVRIDEYCGTNLAGLYAAGEVTGGVMGSNRLSGNSLADITVFGAIAGRQAARFARRSEPVLPEKAQIGQEHERLRGVLARGKRDKTPLDLRAAIQQIMWKNVGVIRNEKSLIGALERLTALNRELDKIGVEQQSLKFNQGLTSYLEAENLLLVSQAMANSALFRKESRGAHYMEDYPQKDDARWLVNVVTKLEGDSIKTDTRALVTA